LQNSYYSYFCERSAASSAFGDLGDRISRQAVEHTAIRIGAANLTLAKHNTASQARLRLGQTVRMLARRADANIYRFAGGP
jgi:hypothetical protein